MIVMIIIFFALAFCNISAAIVALVINSASLHNKLLRIAAYCLVCSGICSGFMLVSNSGSSWYGLLMFLLFVFAFFIFWFGDNSATKLMQERE